MLDIEGSFGFEDEGGDETEILFLQLENKPLGTISEEVGLEVSSLLSGLVSFDSTS